MATHSTPRLRPHDRVAVVGAGMVGLATAWHLQEQGVEVTVLERSHVAAGSSWGNAGWLTPGLTVPLPDPAVLRYGLRTIFSSTSPVYIPLQPDLKLLRFLAGFTRHCTTKKWAKGAHAYAPLNAEALAAFDELAVDPRISETSPAAPFLACFRTPEDRAHLVDELETIKKFGNDLGHTLDYGLLTGDETRTIAPALSNEITAGLQIQGQHFINPPQYLAQLADAVVSRGGKLVEGVGVSGIKDQGSAVTLTYGDGGRDQFQAVVLATGAWLGDLAAQFGVRRLVQAGRGYSFSVTGADVPANPVYFPSQRVACTPMETPAGPRLRVAGMMEFRSPDAPLDSRRVQAIVDTVRPLLHGLDLDAREEEWVGSRPCTADGLPLIGSTKSERVFIGGGHGMWGVALGPVTGKLLAQQVVTGQAPPQLAPFDPLR